MATQVYRRNRSTDDPKRRATATRTSRSAALLFQLRYNRLGGLGFDTKVLRQIIRIRKQDASERAEQEALLELYMAALGMSFAPPESDDE